MATKLSVYNNALTQHLGERKLSSLTENRKPRRVLDQIWDSGFVKSCLEAAHWNFATRTFQSDFNPSVEPDFGYRYAHDKPDDWVRTSAVSLDEYFSDPLLAYNDESNFWFLDQERVFLRIISNDDDYGGDLSLWPESFTLYVETTLAARACMTITQSKSDTDALKLEASRMLKSASAKDAINDPPKQSPVGSWVRARQGGRSTNWKPPSRIRTI